MNTDEFNALYMCVPTANYDWPECEREKHMSGIYSHTCPKCNSGFLGYKTRALCYPCGIESDRLDRDLYKDKK